MASGDSKYFSSFEKPSNLSEIFTDVLCQFQMLKTLCTFGLILLLCLRNLSYAS